MELSSYEVLLRPVVSEKSTTLGEVSKYVFEVAPRANKVQITRAVEEIFASKKVRVESVNIVHVRGKMKRLGRHMGMSRSWKKAIVTLQPGQKLDIFEAS